MRFIRSLIYCLIAAFLLQGCALLGNVKNQLRDKRGHAAGICHRVQKNESLWRICRTYGVSLQEVAELNNIENPSHIQAGDRIFIPGAARALAVSRSHKADAAPPAKIYRQPGLFIWPVRGRIIQSYGIIGGIKHDGINIKARHGAPVKAAKEGVVAFSGVLDGYGNTIIIEHRDRYATVYANNSTNLVKQGQSVKKGQKIAEVGAASDPASAAYLHFQIRCDNKPRNPRFYLPKA